LNDKVLQTTRCVLITTFAFGIQLDWLNELA